MPNSLPKIADIRVRMQRSASGDEKVLLAEIDRLNAAQWADKLLLDSIAQALLNKPEGDRFTYVPGTLAAEIRELRDARDIFHLQRDNLAVEREQLESELAIAHEALKEGSRALLDFYAMTRLLLAAPVARTERIAPVTALSNIPTVEKAATEQKESLPQ